MFGNKKALQLLEGQLTKAEELQEKLEAELKAAQEKVDQLSKTVDLLNDQNKELVDQLETKDNISSYLPDNPDIAYVHFVSSYDPDREGWKMHIDWNKPFISTVIPMGVDGETESEVAASGVIVLATQILEGYVQDRFERKNKIED